MTLGSGTSQPGCGTESLRSTQRSSTPVGDSRWRRGSAREAPPGRGRSDHERGGPVFFPWFRSSATAIASPGAGMDDRSCRHHGGEQCVRLRHWRSFLSGLWRFLHSSMRTCISRTGLHPPLRPPDSTRLTRWQVVRRLKSRCRIDLHEHAEVAQHLVRVEPNAHSTRLKATVSDPELCSGTKPGHENSDGLLPKINPEFARDFCVFRRQCVRYCYLGIEQEVATKRVSGLSCSYE
jgi:hypothetical protein